MEKDNKTISKSIDQSNNQQSVNNPQLLTKHQRSEQSVPNVLMIPQKKPKTEEIEINKYSNIIQSTFPNTSNSIFTRPLQYINQSSIYSIIYNI